jgi:bacteriorhodopsin
MNLIVSTGIVSLFIQIVTALFDFYVLRINIPTHLTILKNLLILELIVQLIEGSFYVWMIFHFSKNSNITLARYYDWMITTPTMLFTFSLYLLYLKNNENNIDNSFWDMVYTNIPMLTIIFILNGIMLVFGYLGELNKIERYKATLFGFIPFITYFYIIYVNYVGKSGKPIFWWFFLVWSLYGVASLLSYTIKNICYNILDLFAKNFFGIYLAYILYTSV